MVSVLSNTVTWDEGTSAPVAATVGVRMDDNEWQACRALWVAVINEEIRLLLKPGYADSDYDIARARSWFRSKYFRLVCDLAGFEADWVRRILNKRLAELGQEGV